jgi:hypothetical protein
MLLKKSPASRSIARNGEFQNPKGRVLESKFPIGAYFDENLLRARGQNRFSTASVISGHYRASVSCPLYPRKRTLPHAIMNQSVRNNRLPANLTGAVSGPVSSQSGFEGAASVRYSGGPAAQAPGRNRRTSGHFCGSRSRYSCCYSMPLLLLMAFRKVNKTGHFSRD